MIRPTSVSARRVRLPMAWLASAALLLSCRLARAESAGSDASRSWENAPATRRSGFTFGVAGGFLMGSSRGYPNRLDAIDHEDYYADVVSVGSGGELWFGGALADYFVFGLGVSGGSFKNGHLQSTGGAFVFHLEAFPLFSLGGRWRDVGLFADFGTGSRQIMYENGTNRAGGGGMSTAGLGAFWETWRIFGDHVTTGPYASFTYMGNDTLSNDLVAVGFRSVFYGGP
jgi:hypothetical protein